MSILCIDVLTCANGTADDENARDTKKRKKAEREAKTQANQLAKEAAQRQRAAEKARESPVWQFLLAEGIADRNSNRSGFATMPQLKKAAKKLAVSTTGRREDVFARVLAAVTARTESGASE